MICNTSPKIEASERGAWAPIGLSRLYYGDGAVESHLISQLPSAGSRVFIVTVPSLANKTDLIERLVRMLGKAHAGTFSKIRQHAPVEDLNEAAELVRKDKFIDTIISVGGGSAIDSAKAISYRFNESVGRFLHHITIPTTLSAAECTQNAGYTDENGLKLSISDPRLVPNVILYDPTFVLPTPPQLLLSTGFRALDHSVELMYHPEVSEMPTRQMCITAAATLFRCLPEYMRDPTNAEIITRLQLASFASLGFLGLTVKGALGLSHGLGYALGSPYGIPHGVTSCLTLGHVVKLKSKDPVAAPQVARLAEAFGVSTIDTTPSQICFAVGDAILALVDRLGLSTTLTQYNVGRDQIPIIAGRATGQTDGKLYNDVTSLVTSLY